MKKTYKVIFHIDLNAFYATCAMIKEPHLKKRVFVVGGQSSGAKGVISTASYKARKYGIHAGMSVIEALNLYPRLIIVPVDFKLYKEMSHKFMNVLDEYSPLVLQASIDEAYLDVTHLAQNTHPLKIAKELQKKLVDQYLLPTSIGIAPTLYLAKMASDIKKPMGITILRKRDVEKILYPMDISNIHGIGRQTYPKLKMLGIHTIKDFMDLSNLDKILKVMKENSYYTYREYILGNSTNIIEPDKYKVPKSISAETTFHTNIEEPTFLLEEINKQLDECLVRLNKHQMLTKTIGFKLKTSNFQTITRSVTINDYTNDPVIIKDHLQSLFESEFEEGTYRLAGAHLNNLIDKENEKIPFNLFTYEKFIGKS
ncbi:DNA polymerase IV [Acholeplasma granularum]|uniref:DNA polymerase IV n=1 Tax=Acholeplasma granularum TaxID=264635 RepID=UPI0004B0948B|nr:DNA polymerase IV [Acholeplasma granularum]